MDRVSRFQTFTRIGFAARGLLYVMIGYLAIEAGRATGSSGVLRSLADGGFSQIALFVVGLGLLAYGAWRISEAALDIEGHGDDAKGTAIRIGHGLSGIAHILLGLLALGLSLGIMGGGGSSGGGASTQNATAWLLGLPAGEILVRLIGVGFWAAALAQAKEAVNLGFLDHLDSHARGREWVKWLGRLGYLARAILFFLVGLFFWQAGATSNPQQAGGIGEALGSLSGWAQWLVAAGLILFGLFSFVQAIYRRITDPQVISRLKAQAA